DPVAGFLVVLPGARGQLTRVTARGFGVQGLIAQFLDGRAPGVLSGLPSRGEGVFLVHVLLLRRVGIVPPPQVTEVPPEFLAPIPCRMGGKREVGVRLAGVGRLGGLVGSSRGGRMRLGHGNCSSTWVAVFIGRTASNGSATFLSVAVV